MFGIPNPTLLTEEMSQFRSLFPSHVVVCVATVKTMSCTGFLKPALAPSVRAVARVPIGYMTATNASYKTLVLATGKYSCTPNSDG